MTIKRDLSDTFREHIDKQETSVFPLAFMDVSHPELEKALRVVSNGISIKLNEADADDLMYIGFEFDFTILNDSEGKATASLSIRDTTHDRKLANILEKTNDPAQITLRVYSSHLFDETIYETTVDGQTISFHVPVASDPEPELVMQYLRLVDVSIKSEMLSGTLRTWDYSQEVIPFILAREDLFPGLFW